MMNTATSTWRNTTKSLIDKLAKERKITPIETMALVKFVALGERVLEEPQETSTARLQVAS